MDLKKTIKYALSHHEENKYSRTFKYTFLNEEIHICARCSGIFLGFLSLKFPFYLTDINLSQNPYTLLSLFLMIPCLIDWGIQSIIRVESNNKRRFSTGFLAGCSLAFLPFLNYSSTILSIVILAATLILFFKKEDN